MIPKNLVLLPTFEHVPLYYDPLDLFYGRPLRLFRERWIKGKKVFYELMGAVYRSSNPNIDTNLRPRYYFHFRHKGENIQLYRAKATMLAFTGFAIPDPRHYVIDHINGNTLDDSLYNLRVISAKENHISPRIDEMKGLNNAERECRRINRQSFASMRRRQLINSSPEASKYEIEIEIAQQLSELTYEKIIIELKKNGENVEESQN